MKSFRALIGGLILLSVIFLTSSIGFSETLEADFRSNMSLHNSGVAGITIPEAKLKYSIGDQSIYAGIIGHQWGTGYFKGLLLDRDDQGYLGIGNEGSWLGFSWDQFAAVLDWEAQRFLVGHNITYSWPQLTLGVAETALMEEEFSPTMFIPIPFLSYNLTQFFFDQWSQHTNLLTDIYAKLKLGDSTTVYGEFMVDHLAAFPWDRQRMAQAYGLTFGVETFYYLINIPCGENGIR